MAVDVRRLRSWMFVPTSPEKFLRKVSTRPVDAIIPDLEDGVVPAERAAGRENLRRWLAAREQTFPVSYVRINAVTTGDWRLDVDAAMGAEGVVVPKATSARDVTLLVEALEVAERRAGIAEGSTAVIAAIESAVGLLAAPEIASHTRVHGLLFGAEDYALDLGLPLARTGAGADLVAARSAIAVAARAAGAAPIDGVHTKLDDDAELARQSQLARELGFSGKSLFHPAQIELINAAFTPQGDELGFARAVVAGFDTAHAAGSGAVAVAGHLVDLPIAERARNLLHTAEELGDRDRDRLPRPRHGIT
jgi:citrate lyase subunit beta/citryl-CoA lyase